MDRHFRLTDETIVNEDGRTLYRIEATRKSCHADIGQKGGFVESEKNIEGGAWVADESQVWDKARICGRAIVKGNSRVFGEARVYGEACVDGGARVSGYSEVYENAYVRDVFIAARSEIGGFAIIDGCIQEAIAMRAAMQKAAANAQTLQQ